jgi:hypothetical protein
VTVTGGTAAMLNVSGVVKDENGNLLAGAIVNNYNSATVPFGAPDFAGSGETAADGKYMVQLPAIGSHTYTFSVMYQGYSFTCSSNAGIVAVTSTSVTNVNFTRIRTTRTISGGLYVAGRAYDPATDGAMILNGGGQTANATTGAWQMTIPDGTLFNLVATPSNPAYGVSNFNVNPFMVVSDVNTISLLVNIPGRMPQVSFTSSGANSDDNARLVNIPVTMTLPPGSNSWPQDQFVYYWIDPSSTAEYGVDYKMAGGQFVFYKNTAPAPKTIPLRIIHNSVPKNKTVVIRLGVGSSIASLGTNTVFTYTISNPFSPIVITTTNNMLNLTWLGTAAARYTIESTHSLNPATWISLVPFTNLTGADGTMTRSIPMGTATNEYFRIKVE